MGQLNNYIHTNYIKDDDYMTPKTAWEDIQQFIPRDKIIWEAFYGDGKSGKHLQDLGFNVIHDTEDFFVNNKGDIIVSNPPFSKSKEIFKRLKEIDKPFILILPTSKICSQYVKDFINNNTNKIQIIIPNKRIHFEKPSFKKKSSCWFDCFYYCYKMDLDRDIIFL